MHRCPELSRLPKACKSTSLQFRGQSPGSPQTLFIPFSHPSRTPSWKLLQPEHPATKLFRPSFPAVNDGPLRMQAFPFAVLDRPEESSKEPILRQQQGPKAWADRIHWYLREDAPRGPRVPMSLFIGVAKKATDKRVCLRRTIKKRIKTALTLVVVRGADAQPDDKGRLRLVLGKHGQEDGSHLILRNWSYIFHASLETYRMPYPDLVKIVRDGLTSLHAVAINLEKRWSLNVATSVVKKARNLSKTKTAPDRIPREEVPHLAPRIEGVDAEIPDRACDMHSVTVKKESSTLVTGPPTTKPKRTYDPFSDFALGVTAPRKEIQPSLVDQRTVRSKVNSVHKPPPPAPTPEVSRLFDMLHKRRQREGLDGVDPLSTSVPTKAAVLDGLNELDGPDESGKSSDGSQTSKTSSDLSGVFDKLRKHLPAIEASKDTWPSPPTQISSDTASPAVPFKLYIPQRGAGAKERLFKQKPFVLTPNRKSA